MSVPLVDEIISEHGNILAPMVRASTLPLRLLSLDYGASAVYTEETIDYRLLQCKRFKNSVLGTVDFKTEENEADVLFRTCPAESDRVVLQLGTCDPTRALEAARIVQQDVAGVDVNMGCPKHFSIIGGMGAALLEKPDTVCGILTHLRSGLSPDKWVSAKIRILPKLEDTLELCQLIEKCGVTALAVHGRLRDERPRHVNHDDVIMQIRRALSIPVIANGGSTEISNFEDIAKFKATTGCRFAMLARAAEHNASIFRPQGLLPMETVIRDYLKYAVRFENSVPKTKYLLQTMLREQQSKSERGRATVAAANLKEFCEIWDLADFYAEQKSILLERINRYSRQKFEIGLENKCRSTCDNQNIIDSELTDACVESERRSNVTKLRALFVCKHYENGITPKTALFNLAKQLGWPKPTFETWQTLDKKFLSQVAVNGSRSYSFTVPERNRKYSEQAASLVALYDLNYMHLLPKAALDDIWPV